VATSGLGPGRLAPTAPQLVRSLHRGPPPGRSRDLERGYGAVITGNGRRLRVNAVWV